jgi:hypothetical protein
MMPETGPRRRHAENAVGHAPHGRLPDEPRALGEGSETVA